MNNALILILSFTSLLILFILSSCSSGVNDFSYEETKVEVANKYKIDTSNFISRNANLNDKCHKSFNWFESKNEKLYIHHDLNGDGEKDFIFIKGHESHSVRPIFYLSNRDGGMDRVYPYFMRHLDCSFASVLVEQNIPLIEYTSTSGVNYVEGYRIDTVVVVKNMILNYSQKNYLSSIDSIIFTNEGIWGSTRDSVHLNLIENVAHICKVNILDDSVKCNRVLLSNKIEQQIKIIVSSIKMEPEKMNYIYQVDWTDDDTATTLLFDSSGKVFKFEDYGLYGDVSLNQLYKIIFKINSPNTAPPSTG